MAGIMIEPTAAASATAEPETPANTTLAATLAWLSPPRSGPVTERASRSSRWLMPPAFMIVPMTKK